MENRNPKGAGRKKIDGRVRQIIASDYELTEIKSLLKNIRANKKLNQMRLQELKQTVLNSIYNYCNGHYSQDNNDIVQTIDLVHKGEIIGSINFSVSIGILELGSLGNSEYPPTAIQVEFRLNHSEVFIYNSFSDPMTNTMNGLNELLKNHENEILCL